MKGGIDAIMSAMQQHRVSSCLCVCKYVGVTANVVAASRFVFVYARFLTLKTTL